MCAGLKSRPPLSKVAHAPYLKKLFIRVGVRDFEGGVKVARAALTIRVLSVTYSTFECGVRDFKSCDLKGVPRVSKAVLPQRKIDRGN